MKKHLSITAILVFFLFSLSAPVLSADEKLLVELKVFKLAETHKAGKKSKKEVLVSAEMAKPGDVLEYQASYNNISNQALRGIKATLPIPLGIIYQPGSTSHTETLKASTDGNHFAKPPLKRIVTLANGKQQVQTIPYSEYRFLRWSVGTLQVGESFTAHARAQVVPGFKNKQQTATLE